MMSRRMVLKTVVLTMVVSLAGMTATASTPTIDTSGATPFVYEGRSYLPLKSTASFLGAPLRWDAAKGQAIISYLGKELVLTPNSLKAVLAGQPVALPAPPVVVRGVTYVPTYVFSRYYNVPVQWDGPRSEVKVKGPGGWCTVQAKKRAPWHGGPPPWAPAWGNRRAGPPGHAGKVGAAHPGPGGKARSWEKHDGNRPAHPSKAKSGGNGKARGNKKAGQSAQ